MNESAPRARDGWIMAAGRRIYHVYKQDFPMEFWYGLTPDANREDSAGLVDVRSLPGKYRARYPVEMTFLNVPRRSWGKVMRNQLIAHALAFSAAIADGYDLADHARREDERAREEDVQRRARLATSPEDDDFPF